VASLHTNRGRKRAREARAALGLDPAAPLDCLLTAVEEGAGLSVVVTDRLPATVAGACVRSGPGALLWVNGAHAHPRQRFTLAHELGHAWCRHEGALALDTFATLSGRTSSPPEVEANAFAAEFLVPRRGLERLLDDEPTLEELVVIAAHYGVSAVVVTYRVGELGLAGERRVAQLEREIEEGLHHDVVHARDLVPHADRLAGIEQLPYLSPALDGTQLDAARGGAADVAPAVADAAERLL
jgi:Zn-dependent peptidase ImmA (M78 family)